MLGVLLQSLFHFPAVLADFYLSGVLEEEKVDPALESDDDDELCSFSQVKVRVSHLLAANNAELSGSTRSETPPSYPPPLPYLKESCDNFPDTFVFMHSARSGTRFVPQCVSKCRNNNNTNTCALKCINNSTITM